MTRFLAEKRDCNLGLRSRSADFTCRSIKTARHVNGANWELQSLHPPDHLCRRAVDRACQACAEYCVDHGTGSVQNFQAERLDRTPPQPGVMRCIAFQILYRAQKSYPYRPASLGKLASGNETIAAIIARPAKDYNFLPRPMHLHVSGNGPASSFHELNSAHAQGDGRVICGSHLG